MTDLFIQVISWTKSLAFVYPLAHDKFIKNHSGGKGMLKGLLLAIVLASTYAKNVGAQISSHDVWEPTFPSEQQKFHLPAKYRPYIKIADKTTKLSLDALGLLDFNNTRKVQLSTYLKLAAELKGEFEGLGIRSGGSYQYKIQSYYKKRLGFVILTTNEQEFSNGDFLRGHVFHDKSAFQCNTQFEVSSEKVKIGQKSFQLNLGIFTGSAGVDTSVSNSKTISFTMIQRFESHPRFRGVKDKVGMIRSICDHFNRHQTPVAEKNLRYIIRRSFIENNNQLCQNHNQCETWFDGLVNFYKVGGGVKPQCVRTKNQDVYGICKLRAMGETKGFCQVVRKHKKRKSFHITSGMFTFPCEEGYRCESTNNPQDLKYSGFLHYLFYDKDIGACVCAE